MFDGHAINCLDVIGCVLNIGIYQVGYVLHNDGTNTADKISRLSELITERMMNMADIQVIPKHVIVKPLTS